MVVVATLGSVGIAWWLEGKAAAVRAVKMLTGGVPLLVIASAYWIVPSVLQLRVVATGQLSPLSSWAWTEGRSTLANGLWLNTRGGGCIPSIIRMPTYTKSSPSTSCGICFLRSPSRRLLSSVSGTGRVPWRVGSAYGFGSSCRSVRCGLVDRYKCSRLRGV